MDHIFISYARADRGKAKQLADALEGKGWKVWWDRQIRAGRSFDEVIQDALTSAKCVVVLWSKESIKSDWVKEEADKGARRKILIPCLLDEIELPLGFGRIQTVQLIDWQGEPSHPGLQDLFEAIEAMGVPEQASAIEPQKLERATQPLTNLPNEFTQIKNDYALPDSHNKTHAFESTPSIQQLNPKNWKTGYQIAVLFFGLIVMTGGAYLFLAEDVGETRSPSLPASVDTDSSRTSGQSVSTKNTSLLVNPSPPKDVTKAQLLSFVTTFLDAQSTAASNHLDTLLSFYAEKVNFFRAGQFTHNDIRRDKASYYKRWNERVKMTLVGDIQVDDDIDLETRRVNFRYSYDVAGKEGRVCGQAKKLLILQSSGGNLKIVDEKEEVLGSVPCP